jgi:ATP-dependent DNA ligase
MPKKETASEERLVSKRRDRPYQAGRSKYWIKIKNRAHPAMDRIAETFR